MSGLRAGVLIFRKSLPLPLVAFSEKSLQVLLYYDLHVFSTSLDLFLEFLGLPGQSLYFQESLFFSEFESLIQNFAQFTSLQLSVFAFQLLNFGDEFGRLAIQVLFLYFEFIQVGILLFETFEHHDFFHGAHEVALEFLGILLLYALQVSVDLRVFFLQFLQYFLLHLGIAIITHMAALLSLRSSFPLPLTPMVRSLGPLAWSPSLAAVLPSTLLKSLPKLLELVSDVLHSLQVLFQNGPFSFQPLPFLRSGILHSLFDLSELPLSFSHIVVEFSHSLFHSRHFFSRYLGLMLYSGLFRGFVMQSLELFFHRSGFVQKHLHSLFYLAGRVKSSVLFQFSQFFVHFVEPVL